MFALAGGAHGVAYPAQTLYSHLGSGLLHDITEGGNGKCEGFYGDGCSGSMDPLSSEDCGKGVLICNASAGYDGPSGVGTPDGIGAFAPARVRTHGAGSPEAPLTEACGEPIGATEAKACGTLDPAVAATAGYYFAYNRGSSCLGGRETALAPEAQREHAAVSTELVGLEPDTEYSYCLIATDTSGETEGSAVTFTTEPIAPRSPSTRAAADIATEAVTLEGRLSAERAPTTVVLRILARQQLRRGGHAEDARSAGHASGRTDRSTCIGERSRTGHRIFGLPDRQGLGRIERRLVRLLHD